jgi:hypothetical protein
MAEQLSDDRLDVVLASVGRHLVVDETPGRVVPVRRAGEARGRPVRRAALVAAAVVLAVVAAGGFVVVPVREAVAGWFGLGSTRITTDTSGDPGDAAGAVAFLDDRFLDPITADEATAVLGATLPAWNDVDGLGAPDLLAAPEEGGVVAGWDDDEISLWIHRSAGDGQGPILDKLVFTDDSARQVDGLGDAAVVVRGDHVLETPHRTVAARSAVLWFADGLEHRLAGDLPPDDLVDLARTLAR